MAAVSEDYADQVRAWRKATAAPAMTAPAGRALPDEVYVPWGRPADEIQPAAISPDPLEVARASLDRMVLAVHAASDGRFGNILWESTARLNRLVSDIDRRIVNTWAVPILAIRAFDPFGNHLA
jgi:hypothetical protein